ncbi:MAG: hypothetical protein EP335_09425 [Alphaproteobacteria bacterium]|nr:MAG: hypothetical protein EP335_09425 [Alphaproteobacteria bacterium]
MFGRSKNHLAILALTGFMACAYMILPTGGRAGAELGARNADVHAEAVPLDPRDPNRRDIGALTYVAGWSLRSPDPRFGGWSGLVVTDGGRKLVAISDQGDWLSAKLDISAPNPLSDSVLQPLDPNLPGATKIAFDSESLIEAPDGGFLVSFEQMHRLLRASPGGPISNTPYNKIIDFEGVHSNSGMEAISFLNDGRLMVMFETPLKGEEGSDSRLTGWVGDEAGGGRFWFQRPKDYSATDAATMKNGDMLLLMRDYSPLRGVSAKILRIKGADIKAGATITGEELATLKPPLTVDNMEGLAVVERDGQPPLLFLISDDNFRMTQRSLLLVFQLRAG